MRLALVPMSFSSPCGLELDVLRHRQFRRIAGDVPVAQRAAARVVMYHAALDAAARRIDAPSGGCGQHQHGARRRARLAQPHPVAADRGRAAGRLVAKIGIHVFLDVRRRRLHVDLIEADVELLTDEHRLRRVDALADFRVRRDQRHLAGGVDLDEGVGPERRRVRRRLRLGEAGQAHAEQKTAAGESTGTQHETAGGRLEVLNRHGLSLRGLVDRVADSHIGAATADVTGHRLVDVGVRRLR